MGAQLGAAWRRESVFSFNAALLEKAEAIIRVLATLPALTRKDPGAEMNLELSK